MDGDIDALIGALGNGSRYNASLAIQTLIEIGKPAVEGLIVALMDNNSIRRLHAATVLGSIGDARAIEPLIRLLSDDNEWISMSAVGALLNIGEPTLESLIAVLQDSNPKRRAKAASTLGGLRDQRAVDPLIAALNDPDFQVRHRSAFSLGVIGDVRAVEPLLEALNNYNHSAAEALGRIGDERAIQPLIAASDSAENSVPRSLIYGLAQFNDARVIPSLIKALHYEDDKVYGCAQDGLVRIGKLAVEALIANLHDEDEDFICGIVSVLEQIKDQRSVEPLINILANTSANTLRGTVAHALGELGDPRAIKPLLSLQGTSNRWLQKMVNDALKKLESES